MTTELDQQPITAIEVIPTAELEPINATEAGLTQLFAACQQLANTGSPNDKVDYDEAHRLTMLAVNVRTESGRVAKRLAAPFGEQYDKIIAEGKRIGLRAKEAENLVRPMKEAWEENQVRLKREAAEAHAAAIQARVMSLVNIGGTYDHGTYSVHGIDVDAIDLQDVSDEDWASIMFDVEHAYMAHLAHQQEAERVRVEELEALNFQKLEQAEREQQLAQREKDLKDQVLALRIKTLEQLGWESNDSRIWYIGYSSREFAYFDNMDSATFADWVKGFGEWKADQAKLATRRDAFIELGWQSDGASGVFGVAGQNGMAFNGDELVNMSEADFTHNINEITELNARLAKQQQQQAKETLAWRIGRLEAQGMVRDGERITRNGFGHEISTIETLTDAQFSDYLNDVTDEKEAIDAAATAKIPDVDYGAIEAKERHEARMKGDKKKLMHFLNAVLNTKNPKLDQPESEALLQRCVGKLSLVIDGMQDEVNGL